MDSSRGVVACCGGTHLESEEVRFTLKDNEIYANTGIGVSIGDDGSPLVEGNHIHTGHTAAVYHPCCWYVMLGCGWGLV